MRRFVDEARAVNRIGHENIIDIFSFGQLPDGRQYFVMEYLQGATLAERQDQGDLQPAEIPPILAQVCDALDAAHAKKIIHRDLKPENVWIATSSRGAPKVRLLDFGIAKLLDTGDRVVTDIGAVMGTPHYMSPEQCHGRGVDHRTDIYAMGVMLYRIFAGRLPFRGETFAEILAKQVTLTPPPPSTYAVVPAALDRLIMQCLEKNPALRPHGAGELVFLPGGFLAGFCRPHHSPAGGLARRAPSVGVFEDRAGARETIGRGFCRPDGTVRPTRSDGECDGSVADPGSTVVAAGRGRPCFDRAGGHRYCVAEPASLGADQQRHSHRSVQDRTPIVPPPAASNPVPPPGSPPPAVLAVPAPRAPQAQHPLERPVVNKRRVVPESTPAEPAEPAEPAQAAEPVRAPPKTSRASSNGLVTRNPFE